jgi:FkbM family methyltransferase
MFNTIKRMASRAFGNQLPTPTPGQARGHALTDPFFDCLSRIGFDPKHVVDVGANRGGWTRTALHYFPNAHYSLFEPQAHLLESSDLRGKPNVRIHNLGAGPESGVMHLTAHDRDDSWSFALSKQEASDLGRQQFEMSVVALDEFLPQQGLPSPQMLKIDAEGWDLEVLRGAERTVAKADVVLLEAAVMNRLFRNRVQDVVAAMAGRDFVLFDITDLNRTQKHGALWLVELAFVRRNGPLEARIDAY